MQNRKKYENVLNIFPVNFVAFPVFPSNSDCLSLYLSLSLSVCPMEFLSHEAHIHFSPHSQSQEFTNGNWQFAKNDKCLYVCKKYIVKSGIK